MAIERQKVIDEIAKLLVEMNKKYPQGLDLSPKGQFRFSRMILQYCALLAENDLALPTGAELTAALQLKAQYYLPKDLRNVRDTYKKLLRQVHDDHIIALFNQGTWQEQGLANEKIINPLSRDLSKLKNNMEPIISEPLPSERNIIVGSIAHSLKIISRITPKNAIENQQVQKQISEHSRLILQYCAELVERDHELPTNLELALFLEQSFSANDENVKDYKTDFNLDIKEALIAYNELLQEFISKPQIRNLLDDLWSLHPQTAHTIASAMYLMNEKGELTDDKICKLCVSLNENLPTPEQVAEILEKEQEKRYPEGPGAAKFIVDIKHSILETKEKYTKIYSLALKWLPPLPQGQQEKIELSDLITNIRALCKDYLQHIGKTPDFDEDDSVRNKRLYVKSIIKILNNHKKDPKKAIKILQTKLLTDQATLLNLSTHRHPALASLRDFINYLLKTISKKISSTKSPNFTTWKLNVESGQSHFGAFSQGIQKTLQQSNAMEINDKKKFKHNN